jgi:CheY-like chemotaxis protein
MQSPGTIYLIDDDAIQLKVSVKMIERLIPTRHILPFSGADTAMSYISQHLDEPDLLPDIILLDLNMPEMSGWDFLDLFEKILPSIPKDVEVHILSSSQDEKDVEKSQQYASVRGYLVKPLTGEKILSLVRP